MIYVYMRILLIAERQNREIKQLESHLHLNRFNGVNYRNSVPAVTTNVAGSTNLDARSSTTNITTNSLPIEHSTRQLVNQQHLHQQLLTLTQQQIQQQPTLDLFLPNCVYACHCHCNQLNVNQANENKKELNEISKNENLKASNLKQKDANNNTDQTNNLEELPIGEIANENKKIEQDKQPQQQDLLNEKTKLLTYKTGSRLQRRSKYLSKQFDVTLNSTSLEEKENDQDQSNTVEKLNQENSIKKDSSTSLTQSVSTPIVLETSDAQIVKQQHKNSNSIPNLDQIKLANKQQTNEELNLDRQKTAEEQTNKQELTNEQQQQINLPHHCCCFNQHLIYCAYQLHSKIIQQNQMQQQNIQLQQQLQPAAATTTAAAVNPLAYAQNLLSILATNFPLTEHVNELRDGYSSASTSTLNNLNSQQQQQQQNIAQTNENQANQNNQLLNPQCLNTMQQLTGINVQFQNAQQANQLNAIQQFNQFLQLNNLTNLICDHHSPSHQSSPYSNQTQSQFTPTHQTTCLLKQQHNTTATSSSQPQQQQHHHQSCCSASLINWSNRKCSDTSTVSGPIASCSSAASKSICSSSTPHCHHLHYPHSIHSLPIYSTPIVENNLNAAINPHANVQFDMNSIAGLHQARSNSGSSSVAVLDEIKRAERQLRKRSKQILTDTKAIRTLGIVMGNLI